MSTATFDDRDTMDGSIQYRAVHAGAIIGLAFVLFSAVFTVITGSVSPDNLGLVSFLNLGPLIICIWSLNKIQREPDNYIGRPVASIGAVLAGLFLVTGVGYGAYVHITEVPTDHTPISFTKMRPDVVQERAGTVVPPEVLALDGKRVFIKGYMRPQDMRTGISRFLLVRDNNQCCFGDISSVKYYDRILVDLAGSLRLNYSDGQFAVGGVLHVMPQNVNLGPQAPVFALVADHAK